MGDDRKARNIWRTMHQRCTNPKHRDYRNYGERGISVCILWKSLENFVADMGMPPEGMSLDRIDNDGPYSLKNCRWATPTEQTRNRRCTRLLSFNHVTMPMASWEEMLGLTPGILANRIVNGGWPIREAITTPNGAPKPSSVRIFRPTHPHPEKSARCTPMQGAALCSDVMHIDAD